MPDGVDNTDLDTSLYKAGLNPIISARIIITVASRVWVVSLVHFTVNVFLFYNAQEGRYARTGRPPK